MSDPERLARLSLASAQQQLRAVTLPREQADAQEAFVTALREGAPPQEVEAARLRCSALFEAQLDLCVEAAQTMREIAEETGRVG